MRSHLRSIWSAPAPVALLAVLLILAACTRDRPTPEPTATTEQPVAEVLATRAPGEPEVVPASPSPSPSTTAQPTATPTPSDETFRYTVQPGDTLLGIATKFGTDVETVRKLNLLRNDELSAGQPLELPYVEGMTVEGMPTPTPGPFRHVVQTGETLGSIAIRFGVEPLAIAEANELVNPDALSVGQEILIPGYQPAAGGEQPAASTPGEAAGGAVVHVVQPGESLSDIAVSYGVSPAAIAQANNLANRNLLRVGQELTIPGVTALDAAAARGSVHVVQAGESLSAIAEQYGASVQDIITLNNLADPNSLSVGQELIIPGQ